MDQAKPQTPLAFGSVACSTAGWAVGLLSLLADYQRMAGATAGVGAAAFASLVVLVSGILCLTGVICGVVALRRIRRGEIGERGLARAGIILGALPLVACLVWAAPILWDELSIRIWGLPAKEVRFKQ